MPNYIFNDTALTQDDIEEIASIKGYTLDELFEKNPGIKETDSDPNEEGKETPSQETESAAVEESVALEPTVMDSKSVTISSDLPEVKTGTVADTEYIPPVVTSKESQKIINSKNCHIWSEDINENFLKSFNSCLNNNKENILVIGSLLISVFFVYSITSITPSLGVSFSVNNF